MLEDKVVRRGEVWWVDAGISVGSEEKMGRPGVVVSGDSWNKRCNTVNVVYTTTQTMRGDPTRPKIESLGGTSRAMCTQVYTVDKSRLDRKMCDLTESEMIRVAGALAVVMQIPQYSHTAKPQPPQKQEEAEDTKVSEDVVALRCERDMWQKMYEVVLAQLVEMRVAADTARKTAPVIVEEPKPVVEEFAPEKPPVVKREEIPIVKKEEPLLVDINHCSELALRELGLSEADVASVIGCRPFESVFELNCVPDLDMKWVAANEDRFICTPVVAEEPPKETGKVNINTCMPRELAEMGVNINTARRITSHRKQNGKFGVLRDVMDVKGIGQKWFDRWADKLEV